MHLETTVLHEVVVIQHSSLGLALAESIWAAAVCAALHCQWRSNVVSSAPAAGWKDIPFGMSQPPLSPASLMGVVLA